MDKMFSSVEKTSLEAVKSYANSANKIAQNYQQRVMHSGKSFSPTSPDMSNSKWLGKMRERNVEAYDSLTNGILLM